MKKFLTAFVLVLALCLTSVPAFAADLTQDVSMGNTTVYHRVGIAYLSSLYDIW